MFDIISLFATEFEEPKIGISGKEFNFMQVLAVGSRESENKERTACKRFLGPVCL